MEEGTHQIKVLFILRLQASLAPIDVVGDPPWVTLSELHSVSVSGPRSKSPANPLSGPKQPKPNYN